VKRFINNETIISRSEGQPTTINYRLHGQQSSTQLQPIMLSIYVSVFAIFTHPPTTMTLHIFSLNKLIQINGMKELLSLKCKLQLLRVIKPQAMMRQKHG
jgi:hypothetical protein